MVDRHDRSHLPGYDDLIARGLYHHQHGGPDHLDAVPVPPDEPIGSVFGITEAESVLPAAEPGDIGFAPSAPFAREPPSYGHIEPDCAPALPRVLPPAPPITYRGSHMHQHPHMAHLDDTALYQQDAALQSCDSGIFSESIHSGIPLSSTRDETSFIPSVPQTDNIPSVTSSGTESVTQGLQTLSIQRDPPPGHVTPHRNGEPFSHSDHLPLEPTLNVTNPNPGNLQEITERFQRNMKYIEQDADLDTNLHHLIYADKDEFVINLLDDLISYQFLDVTNRQKQTILHVASMMNKPALCRAIMVHGATVDCRDLQGNTPLHIACEKGHAQCVEVLTKHLQYSEVKDLSYQVPFHCIPQSMELRNYEGLACLHLAAVNDHFDIVHYLVHDCHSDINAQEGKRGMTALMLCADQRKAQMLMYLVQQCKANIHLRTYDRKNATELALGRGYTDIANLLRAIGGDADRQADDEEDWIEEDFDENAVGDQSTVVNNAHRNAMDQL